MGFVVYCIASGELMRYYDTESKAQAQVTGHNRKAIIATLKGDEYAREWKCCSWEDFEQVFNAEYQAHKWYYLNRSSH